MKDYEEDVNELLYSNDNDIILYPMRWIILLVFCGICFINSLIFINFGAINDIIARILNVSEFDGKIYKK